MNPGSPSSPGLPGKLRLLHVVRSLQARTGGPATVVRTLTAALEAAGHRSDILSLDPADAPDAGPGLHVLGRRSHGYGYTPRYVPWLRAHRQDYDAVIVHGLWQYQTHGARLALAGTGTPWFIYSHGMLDPWFKRRYPLKHLKKWLYWWPAERPALLGARAVLFTCEEERRLARESFAGSTYRERVVLFGTSAPPDISAAQCAAFRERFPALHDRPFWLFLGRIHPKKGVDLLIDAYARLSASGETLPRLVIAGPCEDPAYLRSLQSRADAACPAGSVLWPGMIEGDVKWGALRSAEVFVLSSHQENFGIAIVEALACGTPVLISDRVNIHREIAADGVGLVETDTLDGTLGLLRRWHALCEETRLAMRRAALASFQNRYEITAAVRHLAATVEELLPSRPLP